MSGCIAYLFVRLGRLLTFGWRPTGPSFTVEVLADEFAQIHNARPMNYDQCTIPSRLRRTEAGDWPPERRRSVRKQIAYAQAELNKDFHAQKQNALCLSGGGIRSAVFALGVIQGLARHDRLDKYHYLSTVSGGGYIGSWLSTWIAKAKRGWLDVKPKLASSHEPDEIKHLRLNSRYLTQQGGLTSGDTWAAAALWARNLLLNWSMILPLIGAVAEFPKLLIAVVTPDLRAADPGAFVAAAVIFYATAVVFMAFHRPRWTHFNPSRGRYMRRYQAPLVLAAFAWTFVVASVRPPADGSLTLLSIYIVCVGTIYAAAWGCAILWWWRTEDPLVFVKALSPHQSPGGVLDYEARLSRSHRESISVEVYIEDQQAVETIHFVRKVRRLVFQPGQVRKPFPVKLKTRKIEDEAIGTKDVRVLLRNAKGAVITDAHWCSEAIADLACGTIRGAIVGAALGIFHLLLLRCGFICDSDLCERVAIVMAGPPLALGAHLFGSICFAGLYNWTPKSENDREWHGRADGFAIAAGLVWIAIVFIAVLLPDLIIRALATEKFGDIAKIYGTLGSIATAAGVVVGWFGQSARTPATSASPDKSVAARIGLPATAILFLVCLIALLSFALDQMVSAKPFLQQIASTTKGEAAVGADELLRIVVVLLVLPLALGLFINVNRFSLHAIYRNRLIRAFLGASRDSYDPKAQPDRFTGFRDSDNIEMLRLWERHDLTPRPEPPPWRPFHVVNIALNVLRGRNLALQDRKALPFVATPLWCGAAALNAEFGAFRRASEFGGEEKTISVGTAMAISGAAVSPNMGYHSSPLVSLLLTLFNVRLGWWYGNPVDSETYRLEGPRWAIKSLIYEAFGLTDETRPYVYLSDGGHFDNLGLYEMVRRRCHKILVVDAAQDETCAFEDLANSLARIQMDFGIPINIDLTPIRKRNDDRFKPGDGGEGFAIGQIRYGVVDKNAPDGLLLYLKPSFRGDEPVSILGYASKSPAFPHESTLDQWFTEAQFESYRALGETMIGKALARWWAFIP